MFYFTCDLSFSMEQSAAGDEDGISDTRTILKPVENWDISTQLLHVSAAVISSTTTFARNINAVTEWNWTELVGPPTDRSYPSPTLRYKRVRVFQKIRVLPPKLQCCRAFWTRRYFGAARSATVANYCRWHWATDLVCGSWPSLSQAAMIITTISQTTIISPIILD